MVRTTTALDDPRAPNPGEEFHRGFRIQMRVIGALIMRELHTRYGRENIGYLWLILEPALLVIAIALLHSRTPTHFASDVKPVPFVLAGYGNFIMFRAIFGRAEGAVEANAPLLYHRTVSVFDILLSRALLEGASVVLVTTFLGGLAVAAGFANLPVRPHFYMLGVFSLWLVSFAGAMTVCALTHDNRAVGRLVHPFVYLMMPLSGVFAANEWLPNDIAAIFSWNPLSHCFELIRYGWFRSLSAEYVDPLYLGSWIAGLFILGLLGLAVTRRRIHMN